MKIGLYGLPTAGKTYILDRIHFIDVLHGSEELRKINPNFSALTEHEKQAVRGILASSLQQKSTFIMDGHFSFGENIVFTEQDGLLYDTFVYLYTDPQIIRNRMVNSAKNNRFSKFDITKWQRLEISSLRNYCHTHDKDFFVIDNPPINSNPNINTVLEFIKEICLGYSCVDFAKKCTQKILSACTSPNIALLDGDKTITVEDTSSKILNYSTHIFDGNFYTGFQTWQQYREMLFYPGYLHDCCNIHWNYKVLNLISMPAFILTSGNSLIWEKLAAFTKFPSFNGAAMCADTKFFITKFLQENSRTVFAFGDSMNDYYMLRKADTSYLVTRPDGTISSSLKDKDLGGFKFV